MTRMGPYQAKSPEDGQNPPGLLHRLDKPAWWAPMCTWKATTTIPTTRKMTMAPTLAMDAQNSNARNARADSRLIVSTTASAISTVAQVGMSGNQYCT